jgi:uncharacterized membrane protein YfcA
MEKQKQQLEYAIRLIFGIVQSIFVSLIGLGLALLFPSLTTILFGLVGFLFLPILSMILSCLANASILYISNRRKIDWKRAIRWSWYPAVGIIGISICVLPLEYLHPNFFGDMNLMFGMFLIGITITSFLLQVYAGLRVQTSDPSNGASPM